MKRASKKLASSLEHGLTAYAIAASAAAVGFVALAQPADARIIYRHVVGRLKHPTDSIDMTASGAGKFTFHFQTVSGLRGDPSLSGGASRLYVYGGKPSNAIVSSKSHSHTWAAALKKGSKIGPFAGTHKAEMLSGGGSTRSHFSYGPWRPGTDAHFSRYLGVKFRILGQTHYGWVRIHVSPVCLPCKDGGKVEAYVNGVAYESIPNKSIIAGATRGADVTAGNTHGTDVTVKLATLGELAAGRN